MAGPELHRHANTYPGCRTLCVMDLMTACRTIVRVLCCAAIANWITGCGGTGFIAYQHIHRRAAGFPQAGQQVVDALELAPHAKRAHPTEEHFLPLSFVLGIAGNYSAVNSLVREIRHSVLSMDAYAFERSGQEA